MDKEQATPSPEEQAPVEKKRKPLPKLVIMIAGFVVVTVASYFMQKTFLFGDAPAAQTVEEPKESEKPEEETEMAVAMLDEIVVNPADTGGRRYLAVTLGLQVKDAEVEKEIEKYRPVIRDAIISLLASKHLDQLANIEYRDSLRQEIRNAANQALHKNKVDGVVFSGYVLQ